jgi:hypothetical protein
MGRIVSPAGDITFKMTDIKSKGNDVVVVGQMGMWDSQIYFSYKEIMRLMFNRHLPQVIIMLPIALIRGTFKKNK